MNIKLLIILLLVTTIAQGQMVDSATYSRLKAIDNNGTFFYNVDGKTFTKEIYNVPFTPKTIAKTFKKYKIKKDSLIAIPDISGYKVYFHTSQDDLNDSIRYVVNHYFVSLAPEQLLVYSIAGYNLSKDTFSTNFINDIINNKVPATCFTPIKIDSINFAGRFIPLGNACNWKHVNNVQCAYLGQMNWSEHNNLQSAQLSIAAQMAGTLKESKTKMIADSTVAIVFEGEKTIARKIILDIKGVASLLVGMSGGKTLIVYYVAAPVRGRFVSCVMSHWNNDRLTPEGIPPLLNEVMKFQ